VWDLAGMPSGVTRGASLLPQQCLGGRHTVRKLARKAAEPAVVAASLYRELLLSALKLIRPSR